MPIVAAIPAIVGAGAAIYGASAQKKAASKAANAQTAASDAAIAEQRRQFDLSRADQAPWMQAGGRALGQMEALNSGDFSSFRSSPDYAWALEQGTKELDRSAAARGRLYSGGYGEDLTRFGQGLATQNYNNYYNRLAGLSGTGQVTATNLGNLGAQMAGNIGNSLMDAGRARASAYQQRGDASAQLGQSLGQSIGQAWGSFYQPQPPAQSYQPSYYSGSGWNAPQQGAVPWGQGPWAGFGG